MDLNSIGKVRMQNVKETFGQTCVPYRGSILLSDGPTLRLTSERSSKTQCRHNLTSGEWGSRAGKGSVSVRIGVQAFCLMGSDRHRPRSCDPSIRNPPCQRQLPVQNALCVPRTTQISADRKQTPHAVDSARCTLERGLNKTNQRRIAGANLNAVTQHEHAVACFIAQNRSRF